MADVQIAVIDQQNTEVTVAVPGIQGIQGQTGDVAVAQDGTAALPGIRFQNDTNTGIYRPGADQLAISTNGTGRLFIDANGAIGIGTTSPFYTLDVSGSARIGAPTGTVGLELGAGATENRTAYIDFVTDTTYTDYSFRIIRADTGPNTNTTFQHRGTGNFIFVNQEAAPYAWYISGSERARIDSSGRLGIGTSSPSVLFQSQQTSAGASVIGASVVNNSVTAGTGVILDLTPSTAGPGVRGAQIEAVNTNGLNEISLALKTSSGGNPPATRLHIAPAGLVGVGTSSPRDRLHLYGACQATANLTDSGNRSFLRLSDSGFIAGSGGGILFSNAQGDNANSIGFAAIKGLLADGSNNTVGHLAFSVRNTTTATSLQEAMRITPEGKLLVGTSSDSGGALLQVNGDRIRVATAKTPASATATGTAGEICWDASYIYVCTATNTWKRAALSTW